MSNGSLDNEITRMLTKTAMRNYQVVLRSRAPYVAIIKLCTSNMFLLSDRKGLDVERVLLCIAFPSYSQACCLHPFCIETTLQRSTCLFFYQSCYLFYFLLHDSNPNFCPSCFVVLPLIFGTFLSGVSSGDNAGISMDHLSSNAE